MVILKDILKSKKENEWVIMLKPEKNIVYFNYLVYKLYMHHAETSNVNNILRRQNWGPNESCRAHADQNNLAVEDIFN